MKPDREALLGCRGTHGRASHGRKAHGFRIEYGNAMKAVLPMHVCDRLWASVKAQAGVPVRVAILTLQIPCPPSESWNACASQLLCEQFDLDGASMAS